MPPALRQERERHLLERLELAHDPVAAMEPARAARAAAHGIASDAQGELELQRLHRRVQRVAHGDVHPRRAVGVRARSLASAECLVVGEALVAEREVVHRPLAERTTEGRQHEVRHPRGGLHVAARHRGAGARVQHAPLGHADGQRPVGTGARRDVRVGEDAQGEQASRACHGQRAVEVALVLAGAAREVEHELVAPDRRGQAQLEIALARLEQVGRLPRAVLERGKAGARAPLGVVEDGVGRRAQRPGADPARELAQAARPGAVGGELGPQVGAALGGLAHAPGQLVDRRVVQRPRRDDHALLLEGRRVGGHRPGRPPAHVGVVRPAGGEAEQPLAREDRRDHGDVGQVGPACERVIEHP